MMKKTEALRFTLCLLIAALTIEPAGVWGWGPQGHEIAGRAAAIKLPKEMPKFFRQFEEEYVGAQIKLNDVLPLVSEGARRIENPREEIWKYLRDSNGLVEELYILDKKEQFSKTNTSPEHKKFASERLAAGAQMLRDLWWTAWVTSNIPLASP